MRRFRRMQLRLAPVGWSGESHLWTRTQIPVIRMPNRQLVISMPNRQLKASRASCPAYQIPPEFRYDTSRTACTQLSNPHSHLRGARPPLLQHESATSKGKKGRGRRHGSARARTWDGAASGRWGEPLLRDGLRMRHADPGRRRGGVGGRKRREATRREEEEEAKEQGVVVAGRWTSVTSRAERPQQTTRSHVR